MGIDPTESLATLEAYRQANGVHWIMATAPRQMFVDFNIIIRSTKLVLDSDGVVRYRQGYGAVDANAWRQVLDGLLK